MGYRGPEPPPPPPGHAYAKMTGPAVGRDEFGDGAGLPGTAGLVASVCATVSLCGALASLILYAVRHLN